MSNFKVGEKVVCVNDKHQTHGGLILNEIYIVTKIHHSFEAIYVEGFDYPHWNHRFRKLDHQFGEDVIAEIIKQVKEESLTLSN